MSTRKERRAPTFGHMSPNRHRYQWDGKVNFGISAEIALEERYVRNEFREETFSLNVDRYLGMSVAEYVFRFELLELMSSRLVLWDMTH